MAIVSAEKKLLLSLVDLGLYDVANATQLLDKYTFDYDNDFGNQINKLAFKSAVAVIKSGSPPIFDLVASSALKMGATGAEVESIRQSIDGHSGYSLGFDGYAKEVINQGDKKRLLKTINDAASNIANPRFSAQEVINRITKDSLRSRDSRVHKKLSAYSALIAGQIREGKPPTKVIRSGIHQLDNVIGGFQPTLNLIGAEPGVGKTAIMSAAVESIAGRGTKIGYFALEDDPSFLSYRYLANESGINQFHMRFDKLSVEDQQRVWSANEHTTAAQENIYVIDGSDRAMSVDDVVATSNDLFYNHGVEIIFVDHLGELSSKHSDRVDLEISDQLSTLRRIANRLGIPVVVAAHFRRPVGGGRIVKPVLTDFANSAGAERKARVALGLTREPGSDRMSIHVLKQTNGPSGCIIDVEFDGAAAMVIANEGGQS